jgi:hypothetical protein
MKLLWIAGALLAAEATTTLAQQPAVYPLRSQTAALQSVDSAYCYWQAKKQTGVDMARQSQRPEPTKTVRFAPDAGRGASEPPLPPPNGAANAVARTTKAPGSAGEAGGASAAPAARGAPGLAARADAASVNRHAVTAPASAAGASSSASVAAASTSASAGAAADLPPLPPPPPPMTTYWQAYGDCMQARGYGVQ